ncbi:MAG: UDP-N-acetylglucosamine 2-epimerase (non-hydrolyzing) [Flavobacteriaceae bacterium]|nr:UDP-N-acetylglucosamine 2-epimerase (non-hydrolyzing) [Flavobacteriaceae bacterium]
MKILTILGARPQFIKAGSVSRKFAEYNDIQEIIIHTGQHYDENMSAIFFEQMQIPQPDYFLKVKALTHGSMTGQMMEKIEEIALKENPDWILVYGDTNSTLAGALVASKLHIKLAHIEAGLRSFNTKMPEEINRILTDRVSQLLFCPTNTAIENLKNEGFDNFNCRVIKSGDVMQDGALFYQKMAQKPTFEMPEKFALCTVHRAENTDNKEHLISIFKGLEEISKEQHIILPLHPRTLKMIRKYEVLVPKSVQIVPPVGYLEMVYLLEHCNIVLTDSGGLQKEAFFFQKPCITLREETEWIELIKHKFNILAGTDSEKIYSTYQQRKNLFSTDFSIDLYGNGTASTVICETLLNF